MSIRHGPLGEPPKISGYRKPPLQRIEVFAGRETEHTIELEREHP